MSSRQYIGTVCIRKGNEHQEPTVVYVTGINRLDSLVCHALNTGNLYFSDPDGDSLTCFELSTFERLRKEWRLGNAKRQVEVLTKELNFKETR